MGVAYEQILAEFKTVDCKPQWKVCVDAEKKGMTNGHLQNDVKIIDWQPLERKKVIHDNFGMISKQIQLNNVFFPNLFCLS